MLTIGAEAPRTRRGAATCPRLRRVNAIAGGPATAVLWASTLLGFARASRRIERWSTLACVMLIGNAVALPVVVVTCSAASLSSRDMSGPDRTGSRKEDSDR
jgi:hypothetical protein